MTSPLTSKNTAFFSAANDHYIIYSATSLLSIRRFIPDAKLFILGKSISSHHARFLHRKRITFIKLDLTYLFFQTWDYPIECFYLFAGPETFAKLGFKYSVYLDGDILCLNNPLEDCPDISDIGGVKVNTFAELFQTEQTTLSHLFHIKPTSFQLHRIHSGIIYMNNNKLANLDFLNQSAQLFRTCWENGIPRKGDDSLFALLQLFLKKQLHPIALPDYYNYIPHYVGFKPNPKIIFFHFTLDKPWKVRPYQHADHNQNIYHPYLSEYRKTFRIASPTAWINSLYPLHIIRKIFHKLTRLFRQVPFVILGIRQPIHIKRRHLRLPAIKLYWWNPPHINNFGDQVSPHIIYNLFGLNTTWSSLEDCDLLMTGSVLQLAQKAKRDTKAYVWGSGFIESSNTGSHLQNFIFCATRGKKTSAILHKNLPTGDPGILANATFLPKKKHFSHRIGVIVHYADMNTDYARRFCEDPRFTVISPLDTPENVIKQISECRLILSSSLHGLIFADSLSIPNYHISLSDNITGGDFKFKDYYSGVGKKYTPANLNHVFNDTYLEKLIQNYHPIPHLAKKQRTLAKSFPFRKI